MPVLDPPRSTSKKRGAVAAKSAEKQASAMLDATKARDAWADTLNRVAYGKERLILQRRGKPIAAVVSIDDLRILERLIEQMADRLEKDIDREELESRLADPDETPEPWEEVKAKLGL